MFSLKLFAPVRSAAIFCAALLLGLCALVTQPFTLRPAEAKRGKRSPAPAVQANDPSLVGKWGGALIPFKTVPLHISLLPNGKLLYWGRDKVNSRDVRDGCWTYVVDPANFNPDVVTTPATAEIRNTTTNLFCSAHSFLPDGRLLVSGGHDTWDGDPLVEAIGEPDINIFDYHTNTWAVSPSPTPPQGGAPLHMQNGRWYPGSVVLENGDVAIFSGYYWDRDHYPTPSFPSRNSVTDRYRFNPQGVGTVEPFDFGTTVPTNDILNYSYLHLVLDGKVFVAGPQSGVYATAWMFDPSEPTPAQRYHTYDATGLVHKDGASVLYDAVKSKVLNLGGTNGGSTTNNEARTINLSATSPGEMGWKIDNSMAYKRRYPTATILPDGKVLVSGGTQCSGSNEIRCAPDFPNPTAHVINPELWTPPAGPGAMGTWATMSPAPSGVPRVYHSMAILLPDATVLIGGGGLPGALGEQYDPGTDAGRTFGHKDAEIFYPPYLFNPGGTPAQRPTISWVQSHLVGQDRLVGLGQSIKIGTPDAQNVRDVVLIRVGSVTHTTSQDQRRVPLSFTASGNELNVVMPATGRLCPPGPYMLFLVNQSGTPSVAAMMSIQTSPQVLDPAPTQGNVLKSAPAVARNADGRLQVFYRGGDDSLFTIAQTTPGGSAWTAPVSLGGAISADPVVFRGAGGLLEVLVVGQGNGIYYKRQTAPGSPTFTDYSPVGGSAQSALEVRADGNGRMQAFYRGANNSVWTNTQLAAGSSNWGAPVNLGGSTVEKPAVGLSNGSLVVFVRGTDNLLYVNQQSAHDPTLWAGFGSFAVNIHSAPAVSGNADGGLIVFFKGAASELRYLEMNPFDKRQVTSVSLGGQMLYSPGVGSNTDAHLDVFIVGVDQRVYGRYQTKVDWANYSLVGGVGALLKNSPVAALNPDGRLAMFVRGTDNALYMAVQTVPGGSNAYAEFVRLTPAP